MPFQLARESGVQSSSMSPTESLGAEGEPDSRRSVVPAARTEKGTDMSDPRYDRDPNRRPTPYANRESTAGAGSIWVAAIVAILVIAGIAAYSYKNSQTASNPSATTSGESTRAPVSAPSASVPPAPAAPDTPSKPAAPAQP
jgi:hypothetical protein